MFVFCPLTFPRLNFDDPLLVFVHLAKNYIQAINEGSVPTIRTAWENVVEIENQKALAEAFAIYEQAFEVHFKDNAILEAVQLETAHAGSLEKAMEKFRAMVKGDSHTAYEKKLMVTLLQIP